MTSFTGKVTQRTSRNKHFYIVLKVPFANHAEAAQIEAALTEGAEVRVSTTEVFDTGTTLGGSNSFTITVPPNVKASQSQPQSQGQPDNVTANVPPDVLTDHLPDDGFCAFWKRNGVEAYCALLNEHKSESHAWMGPEIPKRPEKEASA